MGEYDPKTLKTEFPDKWKNSPKQLVYPYEYFNSIDDYQKPVNNLQREDFFSKLKNKCPSKRETEKTKQIFSLFNDQNGEELTQLFLKSDVLIIASVFEKLVEVSINENDINPLYCLSLLGFIWQCASKFTDTKLQRHQDIGVILSLENIIRGSISSVIGDRYVKGDENLNMLCIDAYYLYGCSMSQPLPFD